MKRENSNSVKSQYHSTIQYEWIEKLLETPKKMEENIVFGEFYVHT